MIPPAAPTLDNPRHPARLGLPVVMEQERTLSRLAELSAVPVATGVGSLRDGSPAFGRGAGPVRSEPRDVSPHESGVVDPSRRAPLLVHATDGKRVFRADGPVAQPGGEAAMREIDDEQVPRHARQDPIGHPGRCLDRRRGGTRDRAPCGGPKADWRLPAVVRCRQAATGRSPVEGLVYGVPQRYLLVGAL